MQAEQHQVSRRPAVCLKTLRGNETKKSAKKEHTQHASCQRDPGITNLWGAPAGVACLLMNGVATAILLAYLHHRSGKITTWLVTHSHFAAGVSCIWRSDRGEEYFVNLFGTILREMVKGWRKGRKTGSSNRLAESSTAWPMMEWVERRGKEGNSRIFFFAPKCWNYNKMTLRWC